MSNVKLAIRVRPFTDRELKSEKDRIAVVSVVDDHTVSITNTKVSLSGAGDSRERIRRYYADYTFDSSCPTSHPSYASQEKVFEAIGRQVIECVSSGQSACVMAYGQSATGKTHTMMGSDDQPGLIPRLCRALADLQPLDITVSFLEIYNERVHDLLAEVTPPCHSLPRRRGNARKDLRVREHPLKGPYVQNLRRVAVDDIEALLLLVNEGIRRRRTAATRRNNTSSRSHALLDVNTPSGTLHLADLAGSEKASWDGSGGGGRQKEGANINKSLVALSNVISALVSGGGSRSRFVPYRDSALTWLLKDCFTGGASTYIIATVSPSIVCYGESASTLRWAERARQLPPLKSVICGANVVPKGVLLAQYNRLLAELAKNYIRYIPESGLISYDDNHWQLQSNVSNSNDNVLKTDAKIGAIMDKLYPKSEKLSDPASPVATGSSELLNSLDKNIKIVDEINKEVDKLFAPSLERTRSGSDLKMVAPLRNKKRQYRSQEVLPIDEIVINQNQSFVPSPMPSPNKNNQHGNENDKTKVTILHDSQRAEIVASVTERLYTKLKKKEDAAVHKVESVVDKKIIEPLSELRICTNARQRLMEFSQKALRNKRRIGIPAHTQTKVSVIRVKDQATDVQTDLESYIVQNQNKKLYTIYRDVGTETMPMTPRCKEIAVGSKFGTLNLRDQGTITDKNKLKNICVNTDKMTMYSQFTQTPIMPPPRRKRRNLSTKKIIRSSDELADSLTSVISINISQTYPTDSDSLSSDQNSQAEDNNSNKSIIPPDLLKNHCDSTENKPVKNNQEAKFNACHANSRRQNHEFPDSDDCTLPRVSIDPSSQTNIGEMRNMILGRNKNVYPYNIILSPPKERLTKNIVTFQGDEKFEEMPGGNKLGNDLNKQLNSIGNSDTHEVNIHVPNYYTIENKRYSESSSTNSSKIESNSFIWKQGCSSLGSTRRNHVPVYKNNPRYNSAQAKFHDDFLNEKCDNFRSSCESFEGSSDQSQESSQAYSKSHFEDIQNELMRSCNDLGTTVTGYEHYLTNYRRNRKLNTRTPTEYLHHLVKLRKEVVQAESDTTN